MLVLTGIVVMQLLVYKIKMVQRVFQHQIEIQETGLLLMKLGDLLTRIRAANAELGVEALRRTE